MSFKRTLIACAVIAAATTFSTTAFAAGVDDIIANTAKAGLSMGDLESNQLSMYIKYAMKANGTNSFSAEEMTGLRKAFDKAHGKAADDADAADSAGGDEITNVDLTGNSTSGGSEMSADAADPYGTGGKSVSFDDAATDSKVIDQGEPASDVANTSSASEQAANAKEADEIFGNSTAQGGGDSVFDDADETGTSAANTGGSTEGTNVGSEVGEADDGLYDHLTSGSSKSSSDAGAVDGDDGLDNAVSNVENADNASDISETMASESELASKIGNVEINAMQDVAQAGSSADELAGLL
jgi:hypothetical protein